MERAEPRKIGRLPALGAHARTPPRSAERSLRLSVDETLGESPLMAGLYDMDLPPPVLPRSPLARHAELDDDDIEDTDFVPDENAAQSASSSDMDEEPVWDEPSPEPRPPPARTPARESPVRRTPQSQRAPQAPAAQTHAAPGPAAEAAGYYDTIDFDKITDPFTDTRRAFMRGKAQAPPPPRPEAVSSAQPAPVAGPSRLAPRPHAEPAQSTTPLRASPVKATTPVRYSPAKTHSSPAKGPTPARASPVKARTPLGAPRPAPAALPRASLAREEASPAASPWSAQRAHHSPAAPRNAVRRPAPPREAPTQARMSRAPAPATLPPKAEAPAPARRRPSSQAPEAAMAPRPVPPVSGSPTRTAPVQGAPPTRSNRLLTEELLKWKRRCAELEEELDTMQERLVHARGDAHGWTSEQTALQAQVTALQQGRENDRRAMRQRVRVLESHMADTKIEYDNRYWRLLTSSSEGADELDSVHVQLVVHQNEVTKLQSELAEQRRRLRLAHEQTAFLAGLYAHRGQQQAAAQADDTQRLQQQVAELQQQVAAHAAARVAAEAALAAQQAPRPSSEPPAPAEASPAAEPAALETYGVRAQSREWTEDARVSPAMQPATPPTLEDADEAPAATPARAPAPALRPGMTPMLERTAVAAPDLDAEATPMLGTRVRDDPAPQARKKKRRLIGSGQGFLRLADGAESLSPSLDVPADLPPLA